MEKEMMPLKPRELYLKKLIAFQDTEPVKIITGLRRSGKSSLLRLMENHLKENGIADEQILHMNFESMRFADMTDKELYDYVKGKLPKDKKAYLFLDEVQRVPGWQNAVNSFRVDFECDIYVTGSNAYLLSSEYATYLAGRYVEIKMLPLSFKEFLAFYDFKTPGRKGKGGSGTLLFEDKEGELRTADEVFKLYMRLGGMPGIADFGLDTERAFILLDGVYSTVIMRDILERKDFDRGGKVTNADLLRKIVLFLADNVGNNTSVSSITGMLTAEKWIASGKAPSHPTIRRYIASLCEAFVFYPVKRFDIKGKEFLRTLEKYYIVDIGLRNFLLGFRNRDTGHVLENIVYFELLRRGYDVAIGKIGNQEIDFIAVKGEERVYCQVTESLLADEVYERETAPLLKTGDNFKKMILVLYGTTGVLENGIEVRKVTDFLLE